MKRIILVLTVAWAAATFVGCKSGGENSSASRADSSRVVHDTIHDTVCVATLPADTFTYNLPCQVVSIHPEKDGKALLFLWLHGGVYDQKIHNYYTHTPSNHWDNCAADNHIINYLRSHDIKAIALLPMCHKADRPQCVTWRECYTDVKAMIDQCVKKGLVDPKRIYVAGSSDGGRGTWDFVAQHPEVWAAAIAMSCSEPQMTTVPTWFFNTRDESDCKQLVDNLKKRGSNIVKYEHFPQYPHGGDAAECTPELLDKFFSQQRK